MQELESLCRDAAALVAPSDKGGTALGEESQLTADEAEVARQMSICNACRYCEGFCAVFPAMTRRLEFSAADVHYLANLCHSCGACLHACQYAVPHEFAVNVPRSMARVRSRTYAAFAWPRSLAVLYERNGVFVAIVVAASLALLLLLAFASMGALVHEPLAGNFYAVLPHGLMAGVFGLVFAFDVLAMGIGAARFWHAMAAQAPSAPAVFEATRNVLALTYLDGGHADGCNESDDRYTLVRRRFHHITFYGFMLCFASTIVATLYHYFRAMPAPYPVTSLPVLLGILGGIGLLIGPVGLLRLNQRRHRDHGDVSQRPMDRGFATLLLATSASGLALLAWRDTRVMATLLAIHLGIVLALFITLPYGKFVHGIYRSAALLKWSIERRRPHEPRLGSE